MTLVRRAPTATSSRVSVSTSLVRDWSSNGYIAYDDLTASTTADVWALPATGSRPTPASVGPLDQWFGRFSPNGRWIAYTSNELGQYEIFVRRFPNAGSPLKVSIDGGFQPIWNPNGKELFYLAPDGKLMVATVTTTETSFTPGTPRPLFQTRVNVATVNPPESVNHYDVGAGGNRFLISSRAASSSVPIVLVFDWQAALKR